jgi:uncharacterized protein YndB with AHSA1/START domain
MSAHRRQALLDAPVEVIWELVGNPARYPEWWPRVIEVSGERFEEGDEYVQVTRDLVGQAKTRFLVERLDELREIRMRCQQSGTYADWLLTSAQGGTFVELEMGMLPLTVTNRIFDSTAGRVFFRRWAEQSLDALREAAVARKPAEAGVTPG